MYEIRKIQVWPFARSLAVLFTSAMTVLPLGFILFVSIIETVSYGRGFFVEEFLEILLEEEFLIGYAIGIVVTAGVSLGAGSLAAWVYNLFCERFGGIVLDIIYHEKQVISSGEQGVGVKK